VEALDHDPEKARPRERGNGFRFPVCAKPLARLITWLNASAGEGRSGKIMLKQQPKSEMTIQPKFISL
jgi:hypothetical protein